jgi:hypothetical protein
MTEEMILHSLQKIYLMTNVPKKNSDFTLIIGSKDMHVQTGLIHFMHKLFPSSRFIFNMRRDVHAQSKSGFNMDKNIPKGSFVASYTEIWK